jgi:hypothetical protein
VKHVDIPALYTALNTHRTTQNLSWRDVARQTSLTSSTFSRMKTLNGIDLDGYTACCHWLGVSLDTFTTPPPQTGKQSTPGTELIEFLHRLGVPRSYWQAITDLITQLAGKDQR